VASSTAHDTLARKSKDAGVISGGHPVAVALKTRASTPSSRFAAALAR